MRPPSHALYARLTHCKRLHCYQPLTCTDPKVTSRRRKKECSPLSFHSSWPAVQHNRQNRTIDDKIDSVSQRCAQVRARYFASSQKILLIVQRDASRQRARSSIKANPEERALARHTPDPRASCIGYQIHHTSYLSSLPGRQSSGQKSL